MATPGTAPIEDLARVRASEAQLQARIATLDDVAMGGPSLLPGWTVAHLLTHVARNADSHVRRTQAAINGVVIDQYPGGVAGRATEIESGAGRSAAAVRADVEAASVRLLEAWSDVPAHAWANVTRDASGPERRLDELPGRRWLEVQVHLVDLGVGSTPRGWSDAFVAAFLPELRATLPARLAPAAQAPAPGSLDPRDELAWLFGRSTRDDLPFLGPWQ